MFKSCIQCRNAVAAAAAVAVAVAGPPCPAAPNPKGLFAYGNEMMMSSLSAAAATLCLGQLVSLLITATGFTSSTLARRGIDAPTSQSFCNYLLLALVYGSLHARRCRLREKQEQQQQQQQVRWYFYALLAVMDVEANYAVVKAYQYTSLTSVMLLDCWTIPCVLVLTCLLLQTRYTRLQLLGAVICVAGLALVIVSDVHADDRSAGADPVLGDALVIVSAVLYALSNVSEEFLVKKVDLVELMAFLGLFGALTSAAQLIVLERHELRSIRWSAAVVLPFLGYAVAMFLFYTLAPIVLKMSGSAMLNLSLLTSDMWAVLIRTFVYHNKVDWLYYMAFGTVSVGLAFYSLCRHKASQAASGDGVAYNELETETEAEDESQGVPRDDKREWDEETNKGP